MKICHTSDTHGTFPSLAADCTVVVHSGDMLPNMSRGLVDVEVKFQTAWVEKNIEQYKSWLGDRTLLFSSGNHDFIDPTVILRRFGLKAINLDLRHFEHAGITFLGFPFVPYIRGEWNFECDSDVMSRRIRRLKDFLLEKRVDVLVAHCPPRGCLDIVENIREGNNQLTWLLDYGLEDDKYIPAWILSGHFHECVGEAETDFYKVSNAACVVRNLTIAPLES